MVKDTYTYFEVAFHLVEVFGLRVRKDHPSVDNTVVGLGVDIDQI